MDLLKGVGNIASSVLGGNQQASNDSNGSNDVSQLLLQAIQQIAGGGEQSGTLA